MLPQVEWFWEGDLRSCLTTIRDMAPASFRDGSGRGLSRFQSGFRFDTTKRHRRDTGCGHASLADTLPVCSQRQGVDEFLVTFQSPFLGKVPEPHRHRTMKPERGVS